MRSKEKLVKVRAESELRVGMIVVSKKCRRCGRSHRAMLTRQHPDTFLDGKLVTAVWYRVPDPPCRNPLRIPAYPLGEAIRDGRLYRVIDGLERDAETTKDREVERVR